MTNFRLIAIACAIAFLIGTFASGYILGRSHERAAHTARQLDAVEAAEDVTDEVRNLDDDALIDGLLRQ